LISWYEKCLRGKFANELAKQLISQLASSFRKEFPQIESTLMNDFFVERGYSELGENAFWSFE
jgi:type II restriction enzyme